MVRFKDEAVENEKEIEKSISRSYKFITFDSIKKGFAERYVEAFASFLGASAFQFTLLVAFPQFIGGFIQLFTSNLLKLFRSKKKMTVWLTIFQSIVWTLVLGLIFVDIQTSYKVWLYILLVTFHFVLSLLHNPLWNSWIMDLISDERRGKYLSIQSKIYNTVTLISFVAGGFILNRAVTTGTLVSWAFAGIFTVAIISNLIGASHLKKIHEPVYAYIRPKTSLAKFIKGMRSNSQGNIVLYLSLMSFSVFIAAPFYTPYLLQSLKFNYLQFAIICMVPFLMKVLFARRIGRGLDRYGPKKILKFVSFLIVFIPGLWIINTSFEWFILVQVFTGIAYGVYEVTALAFFINETESKNRISLFTYYNFFNGVFILIGALSSNLFMRLGPFDNFFLNAFMWSSIFRLLILFIRFPHVVREKDRYVPTSYSTISKEVFAMDAPKELLSTMINAKEVISTKILNKNDIMTKVGSGEYIKIKKRLPIITNYPANYRKRNPKPNLPPKHAEHMIYMCERCSSEFRRNVKSKLTLKCPYCAHPKVYPLREDFSVKKYDNKRIKNK